jgi:hypothetical protein
VRLVCEIQFHVMAVTPSLPNYGERICIFKDCKDLEQKRMKEGRIGRGIGRGRGRERERKVREGPTPRSPFMSLAFFS